MAYGPAGGGEARRGVQAGPERAGFLRVGEGVFGHCAVPAAQLLQCRPMRSRVLAFFVALVVGLFLGWSGVAGTGQPPASLVAAAGQEAPAQACAGHGDPAEPVHVAEPLGQAFAEGMPDLPALFLTSLEAHASSATMARPRPHAAAAWQHLYLNAPRRPPRALAFTA